MRRPWRKRIWFWKPTWYFHRKSPIWFGMDEYEWHTVVLGWSVTGQIIIATRHCPGLRGRLKKCKEHETEFGLTAEWPLSHYDMEELP